MYKPIIENESINFKNLYVFIISHLKQLIKYCIYVYIFYFLTFFLGGKTYTSSVSFYTNYAASSSLGFSPLLPLSLTESQLRFDVGNYISSDKFLTDVCLKKYDFNVNSNFIFELKEGDFFMIENGKKYKFIRKRIKRIECIEVESGRKYLFSPHAEVSLI